MPNKPSIHLIGIGGIGISALARWFLAKNWAVSGSDIKASSITKELRKEGVKVKIGHKAANVPRGVSMVVYSEAIGPKNPEILEAKRHAVKPLSYPQALGCLTDAYKAIAVTGSHGKSTTTSLLALMLIEARLDPNVVVGTKLREFGNKNFRLGKSKLLVLEADDFKAVFLNYHPHAVIATTLDREHLDYYKNLSNIKRAFLKFFGNIKKGGTLVINYDDENLRSLRVAVRKLAKKRSLKVLWYGLRNTDAASVRRAIKIPGIHNVSNALGALTLAVKTLGIGRSTALRAIARYRGAWRRFEYRGKFMDAPVYDDYAHHPTEIRATLQAFREKFPKKKIVCVYEPHQAERLRLLFREFQGAFEDAQYVFILPVYRVAGRDRVITRFDSKALVAAVNRHSSGTHAAYLPKKSGVIKEVLALPSSTRDMVIVMMGAGDIADYTPELLKYRAKK